jgi:hypothetical protein
VILLILAAMLVYYYYRIDLHDLPKEISWSFMEKYTQFWKWEYCGSKSSGYYITKYDSTSNNWRRIDVFLQDYFGSTGSFVPSSVHGTTGDGEDLFDLPFRY